MLKNRIEKARTLVEALPYIRRFHSQTIVIKYGGSLMADEELRPIFAADIALLKFVGINPVIVHGGGKEISHWMSKMGKEPRFVDGLRYTDAETMEMAEMVLSGKINREVVALINQSGGQAVGLSGKDAKLLVCKKIRASNDEDLGQVGEVTEVNARLIRHLTAEDYIPVVSSVGITSDGETLNINADHVASALANALDARKLIYLTDVDGIVTGGDLLSEMGLEEAEALLDHPDIGAGMIPKLRSAVESLRAGVRRVHIINGTIEHAVLLEILTEAGIGTMISSL